MKVEEIERLLAEFYEGTTTESQEEVLRNYFRTTEVPGHLLKDKEIFLNLCPDADQDIEVPAHLDAFFISFEQFSISKVLITIYPTLLPTIP